VSGTSWRPPGLRWWQYIGPWPIRPLVVTLFATTFFGFTALATAILESGAVANVPFGSQVLSVILAAALVWICLWLARQWQLRRGLGLVGFLFAFLVAATLGALTRAYASGLQDVVLDSPATAIATVLRLWVPLVIINSIIGVTTSRLQDQVAQTQAALALSRIQQDWMLDADERARRQVADALHDRVQAGLIAACLQLQGTDPADRRGIDQVIGRLEELRRIDVRRAARALSPTLSEVGLASSIAELASQYEPGMVTHISVDTELDAGGAVSERTRLGIYRIIEQCLLNAAGHGRAANCTVAVTLREGVIHMCAVDDGVGFGDEAPVPGSGSALISTWVRTLDGTWSWQPDARGGVRVDVELPGHTCDESLTAERTSSSVTVSASHDHEAPSREAM
jgi:signal transduction histidine kinase